MGTGAGVVVVRKDVWDEAGGRELHIWDGPDRMISASREYVSF